jgi:hypothetical protein
VLTLAKEQRLPLAVLATVLIGGVLLAATSSPPQTQESPCARYEHSADPEPLKSCIEADAIQREAVYTEQLAEFTLLLVAFTVVLAGASIWQGILTRQSINLARQEFVASHRPRLKVRLLTHKPFVAGEQIELLFTITNFGDSTARRIKYAIYFEMPDINGAGEIDWHGEGKGEFDQIVPGGQANVTHATDFICPERNFIGYTWGRMIFGGTVAYLDDNGAFRITSFRRVHTQGGEAFEHLNPINPDYEYES